MTATDGIAGVIHVKINAATKSFSPMICPRRHHENRWRVKIYFPNVANDTITYAYDALGRITSRAINGVGQAAGYDALGRVTVWTNALGSFTNVYVGATGLIATNYAPFGKKTIFSYPKRRNPAFFVWDGGVRLGYDSVNRWFLLVSCQTGLRKPGDQRGPRVHYLRHHFAIHTMLQWYRTDTDVEARLPELSTYLGHVHVIGISLIIFASARRPRAAKQPADWILSILPAAPLRENFEN